MSIEGLKVLKERDSWGIPKPVFPFDDRGWFPVSNQETLLQHLNKDTKLIIELGSWLGLSTRWMLDQAPNAHIVCIDHWQGSPDTVEQEPNLYEKFLSNCWDYRERISIFKGNTENTLPYLLSLGLTPDLVYIDAGHDYDSASRDIRLSMGFDCTLVGDDFNPNAWAGVVRAVWEEAANYKRRLCVWGSCWSMPR